MNSFRLQLYGNIISSLQLGSRFVENIKSSLQFEEARSKKVRNPEAMGHKKSESKTPNALVLASGFEYNLYIEAR